MVIIYPVLTDSQTKKNSVAKSISIYNNQGAPLTVQSKNDDGIKSTRLEGGFLVAITAFAEEKIQNCCVKFESDQNGTFLILKSMNFIGAFLWNDDSELSIEDSEETLNEILSHLESIQAYREPDMVQFIVEQYYTNIL
jgi:hypothetical protein